MTAEQLVKKLQTGDKAAFKLLVDMYAAMMMGICMRYMKEKPSAQDALQEALIKIFRKVNQFDHNGSFEGWIKRLTVNTCLEQLRKKDSRLMYTDGLEVLHNTQKIEPEIMHRFDQDDIIKIINRLPDHYRVIFNLAIVEGYSHAEISSQLGITASTSRTKLARARSLVKEYLNSQQQKDEFRSTRRVH